MYNLIFNKSILPMAYKYLFLAVEVPTVLSSWRQISNVLLFRLLVSFGLYYYKFQRASLFPGNIMKTE